MREDGAWRAGCIRKKTPGCHRRFRIEMEVDTVIMSLGTSPNPLISSTTEGLEVNKWKCIVADEEFGKTSKGACMPEEML